MSYTFGNRPEDVVTDSRGNTLSGVSITLYGSQADAVAQLSPLGAVTTTDGVWSFSSDTLTLVWARTPSGSVYPVSSADVTLADVADLISTPGTPPYEAIVEVASAAVAGTEATVAAVVTELETPDTAAYDAVEATATAVVNDLADPTTAALIGSTSTTQSALDGRFVRQVNADSTVAALVDDDASSARASLESAFVGRFGTRGATRTIYVRATGNDVTGDGTTVGTAYREIKTAVQSLAVEAPVFRGSVVIDVGAGTYKGGIQFPSVRGYSGDDYVKIKGPNVGHPNVPTAIIDKAADATATYGVLAENGVWIWLEDILVTGAFSTGVDIRRGSVIQRRNLHVTGASTGVSLNSNCLDFSLGGIIKDCTTAGVAEMFNVVRSYDSAGSVAAGTIIQNCPKGLYSKAGGNGHLDYLTVQDCDIAVHIDRGAGNVASLTVKRNDVAILLKDAEIHSFGSVLWGAGADANTRKVTTFGRGSVISDLYGWTDSGAATLRRGTTPPMPLSATYTAVAHTGTLTRTTVATFGTVLVAGVYTAQGRKIKVSVAGSCTTATAAAHMFNLSIASTAFGTLTLPSGLASGTHFVAEWEITTTADGNTQQCVSRLSAGNNVSETKWAATTLDLESADRSVFVQLQLGATGDTVTLRSAEVHG